MARENGLWTALRSARAAIGFLTRVPVGGHPYTSLEWAWAPAFFPLIGLALGTVVGQLYRALVPIGAFGAAALSLGVSLALTGALHEDGLADTCDALGGSDDRARVLEILKDSRVGVFGACALIVSLVARMALIARLGSRVVWAMGLVGCVARVGPVWQMALQPYVPHLGSKSSHLMRTSIPVAFAATIWFVAASGVIVIRGVTSPTRIVIMTVLLAVVILLSSRVYMRRLGGITGDFLGATEQLGELAALVTLVWAAPA